MHPANNALTRILRTNPHIVAAWYDDPVAPSKLTLVRGDTRSNQATFLPEEIRDVPVFYRKGSPLRILRTQDHRHAPENENQLCQDEPIRLGTQTQPAGANWLGTAGAPVSWIDSANARHWGLLSNYHVLADGDARVGRTIHQPTAQRSVFAKLAAWSEPRATGINRIDAAVADAHIDGFHTIANRILGLGILGTTPLVAHVGLAVSKSGRTTALTHGSCVAVGASVTVSYGNFTATFEDQDIFESHAASFSAPGDSGSMILGRACLCPAALLFAGNDELTVGNPMRHVTQALNLVWPFN